jgi:hypothetical protein
MREIAGWTRFCDRWQLPDFPTKGWQLPDKTIRYNIGCSRVVPIVKGKNTSLLTRMPSAVAELLQASALKRQEYRTQ